MSNLTVQQAQSVVDALDELGNEATVFPEYSGRGMYGDTCVGIVTDADPIIVGWMFAELGLPMRSVPARTDSMGLDIIIY